jgi:hypothetical protein
MGKRDIADCDQDLEKGDVAGLRQTDEPSPRTKKELSEAWKRNGRWNL